MADRVLKVRFVGDVDNLGRSIRNVSGEFTELRRAGDNASQAMGKFGKTLAVSSALATATVAAHGLSGGIAAIGGAAVTASGALLLLPAAAAAGGVAFGALKIGVSGFGDALKSIGDPEKFAEAIKGLAPAAQDAAKAVAGLKPRFDELRLSVQERLFADLAPRITSVGDALLTSMRPGLEQVASSANRAAQSVLLMLSTSTRQADVALITNGSAAAFGNLAKAAGPLAAVFIDVSAVGSKVLTRLTDGAGAATQRFQQMVASMRESGRLEEIINNGLTALRQLGDLVANAGSIAGSVFSSMNQAGGGVLSTMVSLTGEVRAFLKSAEGQSALTTVFSSINNFVKSLLPGVRALSAAFLSVLTSVAPVLPQLGAAFTSVAQSVAPLVEFLGTLASVVLPPLIAAVNFLGPALGPLAAYIGAIAAAVKIWTAVQWLLNLALLANPLGLVIPAIGAFIAIVALAWAHSETFRDIITGVWNAVGRIIGGTMDWISGKVSGGVSFIRGVLSWFSGLGGLFTGWWSAAVNAVTNAINVMMRWIGDIPGRVSGAIGNLGGVLYNAGVSLISGFWDGIIARWGQLVSWFRNAMAGLRGMFPFSPAKEGPFAGRGYVTFSGAALTADFAESLRKGMPRVEGAVREILGAAQGGFSTSITPLAPRIPGGGAGTAAGAPEMALRLVGSADQAVATLIMNLIRSGKLQLG